MMRWNFLLVPVVLVSALYLVDLQYQSRQVYAELDRSRALARKLQTDHDRLQALKRAQATSARIEGLARTRLQMQPVNPAITTYVAHPATAPSAVTP